MAVNLPPHVLRSLGLELGDDGSVRQAVSKNQIPIGGSLAHVEARYKAPTGFGLNGGNLVRNQFPTIPAPYRLAIIGEAPSAKEDETGLPFQGASGKFLEAMLHTAGMVRGACFVGNVCNYRPPDNDLNQFPWQGEEIQGSLDRLKDDLAEFKPHLVLLLGRYALKAFSGEFRSVDAWRGSLFIANEQRFAGLKCLGSYHPSAVLRNYDDAPLFRFDIGRASAESLTPSLDLPQRTQMVGLSCDEIIRKIEGLIAQADADIQGGEKPSAIRVSFDLEGYWNRITRFSISTSPTEGFIVPITAGEYGDYWNLDDECRIWVAVTRLLSHPGIPKVLQNSLYDCFVLAYQYKIVISNMDYDTMLGHWEMYAEIPKGLGTQASIYTREPHWKEEREDEDLRTREIYCIKDSQVTEEIRQVQTKLLLKRPESWNHFQLNMRLLRPLLYMELRGLKYDSEGAAVLRKEALAELWSKKHELNVIAGPEYCFHGSKQDLLKKAIEVLCKKREGKLVSVFAHLPGAAKKADLPAATRLYELERAGSLDGVLAPATLGEIESLLGIELNVDSPKQMVEWVYVKRRYERQYKKDKKGQQVLTCDVGALLEIYRKTQDTVMKLILQIRALLYKIEVLAIRTDADGRIRCGYNVVGTDTGRVSCYESPTGSGYNLQTVTKKLRHLIRADDGMYMFQCDLAGADGWTVAAHCNRLGDRTMWDDYKAGLKPAKIIALIYMKAQEELTKILVKTDRAVHEAFQETFRYFNSLPRETLRALCKEVDGEGWLYFGCKRVQHGTNYLMRPPTMSKQILKDSFKYLGDPIYVEPAICGRIQSLYLNRYVGVPRWQSWVGNHVLTHESLSAASGRLRRFFGRLRDGHQLHHDTHKVACSNEPQDNTTYANNLAAYRLWTDPENRDRSRRPSGLIIEPLHQVHDAVIGQFPKDLVSWAVPKIDSYFQNTVTIAGQELIIPYEGAYGDYWGDTIGIIAA